MIDDQLFSTTLLASPRTWQPRPPAQLLAEQLAAMTTWNSCRLAAEVEAIANAESRDQRVEAARRVDALKREQDALIERTHRQLAEGRPLPRTDRPRVVVAHRQQWFRAKLEQRLRSQGVEVLASVDDGAEAVAAVVCEQPDLLIVEELLPSVTGAEVLTRVQQYAPVTTVAVLTMNSTTMPELVEAGAAVVCSRRIPPDHVVDELLTCLREQRTGSCLL